MEKKNKPSNIFERLFASAISREKGAKNGSGSSDGQNTKNGNGNGKEETKETKKNSVDETTRAKVVVVPNEDLGVYDDSMPVFNEFYGQGSCQDGHSFHEMSPSAKTLNSELRALFDGIAMNCMLENKVECQLCHFKIKLFSVYGKPRVYAVVNHIFAHRDDTFKCDECYFETATPMAMKMHNMKRHYVVKSVMQILAEHLYFMDDLMELFVNCYGESIWPDGNAKKTNGTPGLSSELEIDEEEDMEVDGEDEGEEDTSPYILETEDVPPEPVNARQPILLEPEDVPVIPKPPYRLEPEEEVPCIAGPSHRDPTVNKSLAMITPRMLTAALGTLSSLAASPKKLLEPEPEPKTELEKMWRVLRTRLINNQKMECMACHVDVMAGSNGNGFVDHTLKEHYWRKLFKCTCCLVYFESFGDMADHLTEAHGKIGDLSPYYVDYSKEYDADIAAYVGSCFLIPSFVPYRNFKKVLRLLKIEAKKREDAIELEKMEAKTVVVEKMPWDTDEQATKIEDLMINGNDQNTLGIGSNFSARERFIWNGLGLGEAPPGNADQPRHPKPHFKFKRPFGRFDNRNADATKDGQDGADDGNDEVGTKRSRPGI